MTECGFKNINVFIQRLQTFFFIFVTFLRFLTFFYFFLERFFYIYGLDEADFSVYSRRCRA